jgi:hypothetical protein
VYPFDAVWGRRMKWLKGVVIAIALLGFYGSEFFYFIHEPVFGWLQSASEVFLIPLSLFSAGALFNLCWRRISIFAAVWVLLSLHNLGIDAPYQWLNHRGFQVHTLLTPNYLSKCRLIEFVENGVEQTGGFCEWFNRGAICDYIMYDTTGEFVLSVAERTPEWKQAMSGLPVSLVVTTEFRASHLFGNFCRVITPGDLEP